MVASGSVLVVCTGNVCRSPYIERRLRQELAGTAIAVISAGTAALAGRDMDSGTRRLLNAAKADAGAFQASALTVERLASADLVVAAAKEHRSAGARLYVPALSRILTLNDLADLLHGVTPEEVASLGGSGTWVRQVVAAAMARRALVPARQDGVDITDPVGGPPHRFEQMAREVEAVLPAIATVLRGPGKLRGDRAG